MLVLAMEFSRGAQRAHGATTHRTSDRCGGAVDTGERPALPGGAAGVASEGRNRRGLLDEQDPRVTPSKRNSDAHGHPQSPQAS
jgi:hypothetical protein